MKDRMEIQQLKKMGKTELVRLVQDCDDENRRLAEENEKKQSIIEELERQTVQLQGQAAQLQGQMADMQMNRKKAQLTQQEPGSLADSMIQVNGVMEAAQNAAKQYLEHMREMEIAKQKEAEAVITAARYQAEQIISKAKAGAEQVKEASTNVLQSLQIEIDKMLSGARGEYEQRIAADTPVPGAEAYINMALQQKPFEQDTQAETGEVPHLDDILYPAADSRQQEEAVQPAGIQGERPFAEITLQEEKTQTDFLAGDKPGEAEPEDDYTDGLSDEIRSVISDLAYRTQHIGETD